MIKIIAKYRAKHIENALKYGRCEHCLKVLTSEGRPGPAGPDGSARLHDKCVLAFQMATLGSAFAQMGQAAAQAMTAIGDAFKSSFASMAQAEEQLEKLGKLMGKPPKGTT